MDRYQRITSIVNQPYEQVGGSSKKKNKRKQSRESKGSDKPSKTDKPKKERASKDESRGERKEKTEAKYHVLIGSVSIEQKTSEMKMKTEVTRTPALRLRMHNPEEMWARIVKSVMRYINKSLSMKFVEKVVAKSGKEEKVLNGDDLSGMVDVTKSPSYDSIHITLGEKARAVTKA